MQPHLSVVLLFLVHAEKWCNGFGEDLLYIFYQIVSIESCPITVQCPPNYRWSIACLLPADLCFLSNTIRTEVCGALYGFQIVSESSVCVYRNTLTTTTAWERGKQRKGAVLHKNWKRDGSREWWSVGMKCLVSAKCSKVYDELEWG